MTFTVPKTPVNLKQFFDKSPKSLIKVTYSTYQIRDYALPHLVKIRELITLKGKKVELIVLSNPNKVDFDTEHIMY